MEVLDGPTASRGPAEGNRWIYFRSPWGMQFELVSAPDGKRWDRELPVHERDERRIGSTRVAAYLREAILGGDLRPGDRIRQEEIAERLGASRLPVREALRMLEAEGLTEHEARKGARVPRLSPHEVDVVYRMRERLEPIALAESMPQPRPPRARAARGGAGADRGRTRTSRSSSTSTGEFHMLTYSGCDIDPLMSNVTARCGTPPSTTVARSWPSAAGAGCGSSTPSTG